MTNRLFNNLVVTIGAMKSATSWLYMVMNEHPEIECTPVKELHYFWDVHGRYRALTFEQRRDCIKYNLGRILEHTDQSKATDLMSWFGRYLSGDINDEWFAGQFSRRGREGYAAEFSNLYTGLPAAAWSHMRELSRNVRIVFMLRSPVGRLWSHVRFQAEFIGQFKELRSWGTTEFSRFIAEHRLAENGRYTETLNMLSERFERHEYLTIDQADISWRPGEVMAAVESFLGVGHHSFDQSLLRGIYNPSPKHQAPCHFYEVAIPLAETEIEAMDRAGFQIPLEWLRELEFARLAVGTAGAQAYARVG